MFGEMLDPRTLADAGRAAKRARVCLVVGTTGVVHPAAGSAIDERAHALLRGRAEDVLPALVESLG